MEKKSTRNLSSLKIGYTEYTDCSLQSVYSWIKEKNLVSEVVWSKSEGLVSHRWQSKRSTVNHIESLIPGNHKAGFSISRSVGLKGSFSASFTSTRSRDVFHESRFYSFSELSENISWHSRPLCLWNVFATSQIYEGLFFSVLLALLARWIVQISLNFRCV